MSRLQRAGILGLLVAVALMAASGVPTAGAKKHKKKTPQRKSSITLTAPTSTQFAAAVTSKFKPCIADRVVNLNYTDPQGDLATVPVAVDRTNKKGKVTIYLPIAAYSGTYQLSLESQKIRAKGGPQQCKSATSGTIKIS
jgi:hypothetical protein